MVSLPYACVGIEPSLVFFLACVTSMPSSDARISQGIKLPFPDFPLAISDFSPQVYPWCMYFLNVTVAWPNRTNFFGRDSRARSSGPNIRMTMAFSKISDNASLWFIGPAAFSTATASVVSWNGYDFQKPGLESKCSVKVSRFLAVPLPPVLSWIFHHASILLAWRSASPQSSLILRRGYLPQLLPRWAFNLFTRVSFLFGQSYWGWVTVETFGPNTFSISGIIRSALQLVKWYMCNPASEVSPTYDFEGPRKIGTPAKDIG